MTQEAARGVVEPSRLISHAEVRAQSLSGEYVRDPMLVAPGRDRLLDVREELADGRNHLVWAMQERIEDEEFTRNCLIALRFIALAYDRLLEDR